MGGGARNAVETAARTVRDLWIAEVVREDITIEEGRATGLRVRLAISFKYESGEWPSNSDSRTRVVPR